LLSLRPKSDWWQGKKQNFSRVVFQLYSALPFFLRKLFFKGKKKIIEFNVTKIIVFWGAGWNLY